VQPPGQSKMRANCTKGGKACANRNKAALVPTMHAHAQETHSHKATTHAAQAARKRLPRTTPCGAWDPKMHRESKTHLPTVQQARSGDAMATDTLRHTPRVSVAQHNAAVLCNGPTDDAMGHPRSSKTGDRPGTHQATPTMCRTPASSIIMW